MISQSKKSDEIYASRSKTIRSNFHLLIQDFSLSSLNFAVLLNNIKLGSKTWIFFPYLFIRLRAMPIFAYFLSWLINLAGLQVVQFQWERQGVKVWTRVSGSKWPCRMGVVCSQHYNWRGKLTHISHFLRYNSSALDRSPRTGQTAVTSSAISICHCEAQSCVLCTTCMRLSGFMWGLRLFSQAAHES